MKHWNLKNSSFKPTDLFDEKDDIEDKKYLKEFALNEENDDKNKLKKVNNNDQMKIQNNLSPDNKYDK